MSKTNTIKIESIKIKIGKTKTEITIKEAKDLKRALEELFGRDVEYIHTKEIVLDYTRPWWDKPYVTWETSTEDSFKSISAGNVSLSVEPNPNRESQQEYFGIK